MISVYLETTVISYLTARPSRDIIVAGHQEATREWWEGTRNRYRLYVSDAVLLEIEKGDKNAVERRRVLIQGIPVLTLTAEVAQLIEEYGDSLGLRGKAKADVAHLAFAVAYEIDFLAAWNMKHIASIETMHRFQEANEASGRLTPTIVTPESIIKY
jgi:hypothetical protein